VWIDLVSNQSQEGVIIYDPLTKTVSLSDHGKRILRTSKSEKEDLDNILGSDKK
jgi:hypothetical protein